MVTDRTNFDQRIEVNLRNKTQDIYFDFQVSGPTYFRVTTEQDIGMDVDIRVLNSNNVEIGKGRNIGATETVVVKVPSSGRYMIQLQYRNSIIRDLMSCPQVHLYLSSLSEEKVKKIGQKQTDLLNQDQNSFKKIESLFADMQDAIDNEKVYQNDDNMDFIYIFNRESYTTIKENIYENKLVNSKDRAYWIYFEIFSDQVFNDIVVSIDYDDRRYTKTSSMEKKMNQGKSYEIMRSKKALHMYSMVMAYKDTYNINFLSRNAMESIPEFEDQLKHVMFQIKVHILPVSIKYSTLSMTSVLLPTFNNLRDLGMDSIKNDELSYIREKVTLSTKKINKVTFTVTKPSTLRLYLKSLATGIGINSVTITDSSGSKSQGKIVENTFTEFDISYSLQNPGTYTINIKATAKKISSSNFFMKFELLASESRSPCSSERLPNFDDVAIVARRSDSVQETHYYVGNAMFRNIYHLGQRQIGTPTDVYQINFPGTDKKNYKVVPFELKYQSNLVTVNLFHDWASDLVKIYILKASESPQDLFDLIRDQKRVGDHSNLPKIESIFQSKTLEYFDGLEKQYISKGKYNLVIMNMDPTTDNRGSMCMTFSMSIYVEQQLKKRESKDQSNEIVSAGDEITDSLDEAVIETMSLCQSSFVFNEMFRKLIKVNGGYLSIDSVYRFDNDERTKKVILQVDTNSVIYVKMTDIYNQAKSLEISLNLVEYRKDYPEYESAKVITSKKQDKETSNFSEKYVEIQQFVRKGTYLFDFSKTVFDIDTDLFPCTRLKFELEVRPLDNFPEMLKNEETCNDTTTTLMHAADPNLFNEVVRLEAYYPITDTVVKKFKFKIKEPVFLTLVANFEKEISGGSLSMKVSHVPIKKIDNSRSSGKENNRDRSIPVFFSSANTDGTAFIHQRLEPYLSGDMKLDAPGEYIVTIKGGHKAILSPKLKANSKIPKCSKVTMFYQMTKLSDIQDTFDGEYISQTGTMDGIQDNCKNVEIDDLKSVRVHLEQQRVSNYMDVSAKIMIPDPASDKKINFIVRSSNKPIMSVVKISVALPEKIRQVSNLRYHVKGIKMEKNKESDMSIENTLFQSDDELAFLIDDTEPKSYWIVIEFENIDFELLQSHCSYIEVRIVREPSYNILATLASFKAPAKYKDISTLSSSPMTVTIDKEKTKTLSFYQTPSYIKSKKTKVLGRILLDVKVEQVQLDILAEHNYISSQIKLTLQGDQDFSDYSVAEIDDEHYKSNMIYTARNTIRTIGSGNVFNKGLYTLLIQTDSYTRNLFKGLEENNISVNEDMVIPFTIKIQSTPVKDDLSSSEDGLRLIDIEYNGDPDNDGKSINNEESLSVTFEFNDSLDNSNLISEDDDTSDTSFAWLEVDPKYHKSVKKNFRVVKATSIDRLSVMSENMVQLFFPARSLRKNTLYHLKLDKRIGVNQDIIEVDLLTIKTTSSNCNPMGINKKDLNNEGSCNCKYPYMGPTCHQCQDEYQLNSQTNECFLFETCLDGTCNDHGSCFVNKKTGRAQCVCEPGFTDDEDGEHCTKCINEDQVYPKCTLKSKVGLKSSQ